MFKALLLVMLASLVSIPAFAAETPEAEEAAPTVAYVNLVPALVGNFGSGPKLKFFKADVSLRVAGPEAEAKVKHHEPLIRNQLVMLFSQQTDEGLSAPDSKEALRQEALKQVQQVLTQEEGEPLVENLLFNNLILQR